MSLNIWFSRYRNLKTVFFSVVGYVEYSIAYTVDHISVSVMRLGVNPVKYLVVAGTRHCGFLLNQLNFMDFN
jgi:hypothetical protein